MDKIKLALAIIVAVSIGLLIDDFGLELLVGKGFSYETVSLAVIFNIIAVFLVGFVSAFIVKKREIPVSLLAFFIANFFWTYHEFQGLRQTTINFASILIYIVLPFLTRMAVALLGGFLAKKLNQLQKKKTGDS